MGQRHLHSLFFCQAIENYMECWHWDTELNWISSESICNYLFSWWGNSLYLHIDTGFVEKWILLEFKQITFWLCKYELEAVSRASSLLSTYYVPCASHEWMKCSSIIDLVNYKWLYSRFCCCKVQVHNWFHYHMIIVLNSMACREAWLFDCNTIYVWCLSFFMLL